MKNLPQRYMIAGFACKVKDVPAHLEALASPPDPRESNQLMRFPKINRTGHVR